MDFWPEFLASSWGKEFVAGGFGGVAGIFTGYPLDTLRIRQQQRANTGSAFSVLRNVVGNEGPLALYRGMAAPLASVTFQNAMVFQIYAVLSRAKRKRRGIQRSMARAGDGGFESVHSERSHFHGL